MIQNVFIWVVIGIWVAYKREWYSNQNSSEDVPAFVRIVGSTILGPISLLIAFFREMVFNKWDNKNY